MQRIRTFSLNRRCGVTACSLLGVVAALADGPPGDVQTAAFGPATSRLGYNYDVGIAAFNGQPVNAPSNTLTITVSGGAILVSISTPFGTAMLTSDTTASWLVDLPPSSSRSATVTVQPLLVTTKTVTSTLVAEGITDTNLVNNTAMSTTSVGQEPDATQQPGVTTYAGCPLNTFSGMNYFAERPDLNLDGPGWPMVLQRSYDSGMFADGVVQSALGPNWQHNYDLRLNLSGTNATVAFREGRILRFENDGANWNLLFRNDVPFRLVESGGGFILGDPRSQFMYFFDANGLLVRIEDGRGNTNFLSYSGTLLTNVNDGLNRQLTFTYNGAGQLTNVTDGFRSVSYGYGSSNLVAFVDAPGHTTTYAYDPANTNNPALLSGRTLPEGNTPYSQVYGADGRVTSQTDAAANTLLLAYGLGNNTRLTTTTDPLGFTNQHIYNLNGELSRIIDEAGNQILITSDAAGRRNSVRDRKNNLTLLTYSATNGFPTLINLPANPDESFAYSPRVVNGLTFFDLTQAAHPDGTTDLYGYDGSGNRTSHTNRVGDVWRYGRNARGQLLAVTNPLGGVAAFTYNANARLASSADSDLGATTYEYDSLNRLTNLTHPNPTTVRFAYDALDRLTSITDERTNTITFQYDRNSRLTNVVDALGQSHGFEYDALDRLARTVDRLGEATSFAYDPRSLLSAVTNRNGFATRLVYDARRRLIAVVSPAGTTNSFEYDDDGLLLAQGNPLGETFRWQRDAMGYVTNVLDPLSNSVSFALDSLKRVTTSADQLGRETAFAYDGRGLLTNVTREAGIAASYRRNALGLVTNIVDPNSSQWHLAYTAMGRAASFTDPLARATLYERDARGRINRVTYPDGVTRTNTFDGANNLVQVSHSDGTAFQFAYDALDRLTNAAASPPFEFAYDAEDRLINTRQDGLDFGATYDADGRLTSVSYSNGWFTVSYVYDSRDRLIHASDNLTGHGMGFGYDAADRLTTISRSNGVSTAYTYDARGLMTRIQTGSIIDLFYTLDAAGQVTEADYAAAPLDPTTVVSNSSWNLTYDAASQVSTAGYEYDPRGRLSNSLAGALQWDGASRLVGIGAVELEYNALGDLVSRAEGGTTNHYFYNFALRSDPIVAERNESSGQFKRLYVWSPGGLLLYIVELPGLAVRYPHFDRVGSTLALTDGSGAVTDAYAYDPYGRLLARTGTNQQPFQFVGRSGVRFEAAGNLSHMRARYYDPVTTCFLSPEPIWPDLVNPVRLNPYQYAMRNPLNYNDPAGTLDNKELKDVEKMNDKELAQELFEGEVDARYGQWKRDHPPPRHGKHRPREPSESEWRVIRWEARIAIRNYLNDLKRSSGWLDQLRKRVQEQRDKAAAAAKALPESGDGTAPKGGGVVIPGGPPVGPPPPEPIPVPWNDPQTPSGGEEHHGSLFGGGAGDGTANVGYCPLEGDSARLLYQPIKPPWMVLEALWQQGGCGGGWDSPAGAGPSHCGGTDPGASASRWGDYSGLRSGFYKWRVQPPGPANHHWRALAPF